MRRRGRSLPVIVPPTHANEAGNIAMQNGLTIGAAPLAKAYAPKTVRRRLHDGRDIAISRCTPNNGEGTAARQKVFRKIHPVFQDASYARGQARWAQAGGSG